jgi:hypothetical protein
VRLRDLAEDALHRGGPKAAHIEREIPRVLVRVLERAGSSLPGHVQRIYAEADAKRKDVRADDLVLSEIVHNIVGAVKALAHRTFGEQFGDVTPGQIRALAVVALRSMTAPAPGPTTDGPSGSRFSAEDAKEKVRNIALAAGNAGPVEGRADIGHAPQWLVDAAEKAGFDIKCASAGQRSIRAELANFKRLIPLPGAALANTRRSLSHAFLM